MRLKGGVCRAGGREGSRCVDIGRGDDGLWCGKV